MENPARREVVVPGQPLDSGDREPGPGTYTEGGTIYAALVGIKDERGGSVGVIPLNGRYMPVRGDMVVGKVIDMGPGHWLLDIRAPYPAPLHATESPWTVDYGDTQRFLDFGDPVLAGVLTVDEAMRIQVTLNGPGLRKLQGGVVLTVSPAKVPRVIGKKGSMVAMIKNYTKCRVFVGQNGWIWVDGKPEDVANVTRVIEIIEQGAQAVGLTEAVRVHLESLYEREGG